MKTTNNGIRLVLNLMADSYLKMLDEDMESEQFDIFCNIILDSIDGSYIQISNFSWDKGSDSKLYIKISEYSLRELYEMVCKYIDNNKCVEIIYNKKIIHSFTWE